jgi:hypothetical protein
MVDLLVVWDNSGYGEELQYRFLEALDDLERALPESADVHVGAVSQDLGSGEFFYHGCVPGGDEAVLRTRRDGGDERFGRGGVEVISEWLQSILPEADIGCAFEMYLEATARALTLQSDSGRPNEGFLRDESVVVVLYVGEDDDCSTRNYELFRPDDETLGSIGTRCSLHHELLDETAEYVAILRELRAECPSRLVVGGVIGVPVGWDGDLGISELVPELVEGSDELIVHVCQEDVWASPAPRLASVLVALGGADRTVSVCADDYGNAMARVGQRVAEEMER